MRARAGWVNQSRERRAKRCAPVVRTPPIKTGGRAKAAKTPAFNWVITALGNMKAAILGTYRAVREKHVPRYLAEFEYRFSRGYKLVDMIPRLAFFALRTPPMPYKLLKLVDVYA